MNVTLTARDRYVLARLAGSLDDTAGDVLDQKLHPLIDRKGARQLLVLDLSGCERLNSEGIGHLVRLAMHANTTGNRLVLVAVPPWMAEVFGVTRLDRFFEIAATADQVVS
ncbi:MAG: STAS domain-containing protein [Planctomycetia bacterium]|nr:STAS domain-containing protein [Planctomycetia bacterium]